MSKGSDAVKSSLKFPDVGLHLFGNEVEPLLWELQACLPSLGLKDGQAGLQVRGAFLSVSRL